MNSQISPDVTTVIKKSNNRSLILLIIVLMIITAVITILATVFVMNSKEPLNTANVTLNNNSNTVSQEENCEISTYSNSEFPDLNFEYDCNWELSEDIVETNNYFNDYLITLTNGGNTLEFRTDGPLVGASASCTTKEYEELANGTYRVQFEESDETAIYKYFDDLSFRGSDVFDAVVESSAPYADYSNESFCFVESVPYSTDSNISVEENNQGLLRGRLVASISPTLRVSDNAEILDIVSESDKIIMSLQTGNN